MTELTPHQTRALDFEHSIALRANAGSGKTFVLAKRFLQIATAGNVPLRKIAAITFTDKAAGELYKRIAEEIENQLEVSEDDSDKLKLEKIRRQLVSANISTIHSFCINILREFPVEAELDANFIPIDQNTSAELLELSIEESIRKKIEDPDNQKIKYLIRLFGAKNNLVRELRRLIDYRKIVLKLYDEIYKKDIDQIAEYFRDSFTSYFKQIFLPQIKILIEELTKINNEVLNNVPQNGSAKLTSEYLTKLRKASKPENTLMFIGSIINEIFTKDQKLKKKEYFPAKLREGFEKQIKAVEEILSELNKIQLDDNSSQVEYNLAVTGKYLINIFTDTLNLYENKKKELGFLDYEDILIKTKKLLNSKAVAEYLATKFNYLMVDEYQDTNEIQYEIFMPILDFLKKGNLFIVGDEKQSIYRFREAELKVFDQTNSDIREKSGDEYLINLPDSFRMQPAICVFTNVLFKKLFNNPDKFFNEVDYSELICANSDESEGSVSIVLAKEDAQQNEPKLVSEQIIKLVNGQDARIEWKDIAVLVRKRIWFKELEKQFIAQKIPYRIIGGRGFFQRQSICDIYNYFSFLLDSCNDAALVGILRSPFFSVSDSQIFEISLNSGNSFWEKLIKADADNQQLAFIIRQLEGNIQLATKSDFTDLLRKILDETNFISVLASRTDSDQEIANIDKLLKITKNFTNKGFKTLYDYVNFLNESINKLEDEAQAGLTTQANAVSILTLHQAKGLEFPVVFLYKCAESIRSDSVGAKSVSIDRTFGLLTKVSVDEDYFSEYKSAPVIAIRDYIEKRKELAEAKRLFYVGVTRTKNHLCLSGTERTKSSYSPNSFMGMLYNGLNLEADAEECIVSDSLMFLIKSNSEFKNEKRDLQLKIPVLRKIGVEEKTVKIYEEEFQAKEFLLKEVSDKSKGEIISATKVTVYSQCPLKFKLIYKYGYSELFSGFRNLENTNVMKKSGFAFSYREDFKKTENSEVIIKSNFADIKGRIVHKALQNEVELEKIESFVVEQFNSFYRNLIDSKEAKESVVTSSIEILKKYYQSSEYRQISKYPSYKNEFEIYLKKDDYYLFGIIDKVIFDNKKIIIVDYKTDDIERKKINERAEYYLNQLKFYVYIVSRLYEEFDEFEIRIVFLNHPDSVVTEIINRNNIWLIEGEISNIISGILKEEYSKNLLHCRECSFSDDNNKCVV